MSLTLKGKRLGACKALFSRISSETVRWFFNFEVGKKKHLLVSTLPWIPSIWFFSTHWWNSWISTRCSDEAGRFVSVILVRRSSIHQNVCVSLTEGSSKGLFTLFHVQALTRLTKKAIYKNLLINQNSVERAVPFRYLWKLKTQSRGGEKKWANGGSKFPHHATT